MCLIIQKPKDCQIPRAWAVNSFDNNPDGFGAMWSDGQQVFTVKTFDLQDSLDIIDMLADVDAFFHWRFATHGGVNLSNCHPIQVNEEIFMMHNGIITIDTEPGLSDTATYAKVVLAPLFEKVPSAWDSQVLQDIVERSIGKNKIVLLRADGASKILNKGEGSYKEGMWLSNSYSIERSVRYTYTGTTGTYGKYNKTSKKLDFKSWDDWVNEEKDTDYGTSGAVEEVPKIVMPKGGYLLDERSPEIPEESSNEQRQLESVDLDYIGQLNWHDLLEFCKDYPDEIANAIWKYYTFKDEPGVQG